MTIILLLTAVFLLCALNIFKLFNHKNLKSLHAALILFLTIDVLLSLIAFVMPMIFDSFDRFGLSTIRKSYGFIRQSTESIDLIVLLIYASYSLALNFARVHFVKVADKIVGIPEIISNSSVVFLILLSIFLMIPFFIFGEKSGYFWTTSVFYTAPFAFALLSKMRNKNIGYILIFIFSVIFMLRGSKGDIIYLLITIFLYNFIGKKSLKYLIIFTPFVALAGVLISLLIRNEAALSGELVEILILREYAFEMTGALLFYSDIKVIPSWILFELTSLVPAFLLPLKIRPSNFALETYMPDDYISNPDSGFYRSVFFPFIHDFGVVEGVLSTFVLLFILISFVRNVSWASSRIKFSISLPLVVYVHWLSNGEFGIYLINCFFSSVLLYFLQLIIKIPRLKD